MTKLISFALLFTTVVLSTATTVEEDNVVRSQCRSIYETAFPPSRWTTLEDVEAFAKLHSTNPGNYFACPVGVEERTLTNYAPQDIMNWVETHGFTPSDGFRYSSTIAGPIFVSGKTCSFQNDFIGLFGGSCLVTAAGYQTMELDEEGKMYRWAHYWDFNNFDADVAKCMEKLKTATSFVDA